METNYNGLTVGTQLWGFDKSILLWFWDKMYTLSCLIIWVGDLIFSSFVLLFHFIKTHPFKNMWQKDSSPPFKKTPLLSKFCQNFNPSFLTGPPIFFKDFEISCCQAIETERNLHKMQFSRPQARESYAHACERKQQVSQNVFDCSPRNPQDRF